MRRSITFFTVLLVAASADIQSRQQGEPDRPTPRRSLNLRVFQDDDRPLTGVWMFELDDFGGRKVELKPLTPGSVDALVGVDPVARVEILRLEKKLEGIGYEGTLRALFDPCGLGELAVSDFVPIGDVVMMSFKTEPTEAPCPAIDSGRAGRFLLISPQETPIPLRSLADISDPDVRSRYGIGGDRPNVDPLTTVAGTVRVDSGTEVRFIKRLKAPLDGSYWFEVEIAEPLQEGVAPPRGFVGARSLRFHGSLTLKRAS